ncbi:hypothetical protein ABZP36_002654 [Zizania latifolia]
MVVYGWLKSEEKAKGRPRKNFRLPLHQRLHNLCFTHANSITESSPSAPSHRLLRLLPRRSHANPIALSTKCAAGSLSDPSVEEDNVGLGYHLPPKQIQEIVEGSLGAMDHEHWSMNIGTRHAEQEHGLSLRTAKMLAHRYYLKDLQKVPIQIQVCHSGCPTIPIIVEGGQEANDRYIEQLGASAEAVVNEIVGGVMGCHLPCRLVILPFERHPYAARESIMHSKLLDMIDIYTLLYTIKQRCHVMPDALIAPT